MLRKGGGDEVNKSVKQAIINCILIKVKDLKGNMNMREEREYGF